jgi:hypothetical protein
MQRKEDQKVLNKTEEDLINALKGVDTVGFAALKLGISTKKAYNVLYSLRKKYARARRLVNKIDSQKKYHLLDMVLTDRMQKSRAEKSKIKQEEFLSEAESSDREREEDLA